MAVSQGLLDARIEHAVLLSNQYDDSESGQAIDVTHANQQKETGRLAPLLGIVLSVHISPNHPGCLDWVVMVPVDPFGLCGTAGPVRRARLLVSGSANGGNSSRRQ